jgi:hypothetical protein
MLMLVLGLSCGGALFAQALKPVGTFQQDTLKVGEPVTYVLSFRYPRELEVVFPGKDGNFAPFEYLDRSFAPTSSDSAFSYDSVAYELTTFELDTIQSLALPVYVVSTDREGKPDSTAIYASLDSVYINRVIRQLPDSVNLKENLAYRDVPLAFNYPYLLVGIALFLLLAVLVYVFFGKKIRQAWLLYRLRKDQKMFNEEFARSLESLRKSPNRRRSENTLLLWKRYMERLDRLPYTKLTTKEIVKLPSGNLLQNDLRAIDRSIYGRLSNGELIRPFEHLQKHTDHRFKQRIEEIKNAR